MHHPEVEKQVAHPFAGDQLAARLDETAGKREEQVPLQTQRPRDTPTRAQRHRFFQRSFLVGAVRAAGEAVANVVRAAVAIGEEARGDEETKGDTRDDSLQSDQHKDGDDDHVLAEGELEERVPEPFAEQREPQIDQQAGQNWPRHVEHHRSEEQGNGRAEYGCPDPGRTRHRAGVIVQQAPAD